MSNYAWGMSGTSNKYSQAYIAANFTHTTTAGTNTPQMIAGLRAAVAGHNPSDFIYDGVYHNNRLTGPLSGSEWHGYVRTDLSVTYKMPQAVSVSPMDPSLDFGLSTWTAVHAPQQNAGHWITIYAWSGVWDGSPIYLSPAISYDDSGVSPGVQGTDPAANIYTMIKTWNPNHGTDGVVW